MSLLAGNWPPPPRHKDGVKDSCPLIPFNFTRNPNASLTSNDSLIFTNYRLNRKRHFILGLDEWYLRFLLQLMEALTLVTNPTNSQVPSGYQLEDPNPWVTQIIPESALPRQKSPGGSLTKTKWSSVRQGGVPNLGDPGAALMLAFCLLGCGSLGQQRKTGRVGENRPWLITDHGLWKRKVF